MHDAQAMMYLIFQAAVEDQLCLFSRSITVKKVMKTNANHRFIEPRASLFAFFCQNKSPTPKDSRYSVLRDEQEVLKFAQFSF